VPYSFWEKRPKTGQLSPEDSTGELLHKNNVLWAVDVAWLAKPGVRVYGEFMMDDYSFSSDYKPDMIGYQAGAEWRRAVNERGAIGLAAEYSRVNNFTYSTSHGHDFSYNGFPTGYVLGPDVQAVNGEATLEWGAAWEFRIRGEWRRKGEGQVGDAWDKSDGEVDASAFQGVVERETRFGGSVVYTPARWLRLEAAVGTASVDNWRHAAGDDVTKTPFRFAARAEW